MSFLSQPFIDPKNHALIGSIQLSQSIPQYNSETLDIVLQWFPPPEYAIAIPATLLVLGLALISIFISCVFISESRKKKSQ
jgi:hypothetical protein